MTIKSSPPSLSLFWCHHHSDDECEHCGDDEDDCDDDDGDDADDDDGRQVAESTDGGRVPW